MELVGRTGNQNQLVDESVEKYKQRQNRRMRDKYIRDTSPRGSEQTVIMSLCGNGLLFGFKSIAAINVRAHTSVIFITPDDFAFDSSDFLYYSSCSIVYEL